MAYLEPPLVIFTNKCCDQMNHHKLTEDEVLYAFNYPHKTTKAWYGQALFNAERDFGQYKVTVVYRRDSKLDKWILITCWKNLKLRRHSIKWWFAHLLG